MCGVNVGLLLIGEGGWIIGTHMWHLCGCGGMS